MIIEQIKVENFRCIREETLIFSKQTALVGPNGCGKSSFLRAIELFYELSSKINKEDFFNRNTDVPITISVTYCNLTQEERDLYKVYLDGDLLTIKKQIEFIDGRIYENYHGSKMQNPEFQNIRSLPGATPKRNEYNVLRNKYTEFPSISKADDIEPILQKWESEHPDACKMIQDNGQFFGFREVGNARLDRYTKFFLVPAVRDASDEASERKGSLTDLLDLVVMAAIKTNPELIKFKTSVVEKYREIVDPTKLTELPQLASDLTNTLQTYVPNSKVTLEWIINEPEIPIPNAYAKLVEDDYEGDITKKGHGLQRAFILTLLQHLAIVKAEYQEEQDNSEMADEGYTKIKLKIPNLVIAIEEPELYQHPNRQRYLASIFQQLTESGISDVEHLQLVYSTHSPIFVDIENFDNIRILHKSALEQNTPQETKIQYSTMQKIANKLENFTTGQISGKYTAESLRARLKNIMNPVVNEGFFSNTLVLVEGESDKFAISQVAELININFEKLGITIIPVRGKTNMPTIFQIFSSLNIRTYMVFDCDKHNTDDAHPETNKLLLKMCGCTEEEFPKTDITKNEAHFEENLETLLKKEIGEDDYQQLLTHYCHEFGYKIKGGEKNPIIISNIIKDIYAKGKKLPTLENIVNTVVKLSS